MSTAITAAGKGKGISPAISQLWGDVTLVWHHITSHSHTPLPPTATAVFVVFTLITLAVAIPVLKFLAVYVIRD